MGVSRHRQIKVLKLAQRIADAGEVRRADDGHVTDAQLDTIALMHLPPALRRRVINVRKERDERGF